jgi:hypothetical protein
MGNEPQNRNPASRAEPTKRLYPYLNLSRSYLGNLKSMTGVRPSLFRDLRVFPSPSGIKKVPVISVRGVPPLQKTQGWAPGRLFLDVVTLQK